MAEGVGLEPTSPLRGAGFQDQCLSQFGASLRYRGYIKNKHKSIVKKRDHHDDGPLRFANRNMKIPENWWSLEGGQFPKHRRYWVLLKVRIFSISYKYALPQVLQKIVLSTTL